MEAEFTAEGRVPRERLRALGAKRDGPGAARFAVQGLLLVITSTALVLAPAGWPLVVAMTAAGLVQYTFFGPLHECCHGTPFASRRLHAVVSWTASFVQFFGPSLMRSFHFAHHRHTHELAKDPELGGMAFMARWPRGLMWLVTVSGLPILMARTGWLLLTTVNPPWSVWTKTLPFVQPADRAAIVRDSRVLFLLHAALIAAGVWWWPPLLRWYGAAWVGHAFLSVHITCEHRGLPEGGDVLDRTRSFGGNRLLDWFLWNMPYHAEHHAYPAVPFHALPALHAELDGQLPHDGGSVLGLHLRRGR